jgi:hypothetical protein
MHRIARLVSALLVAAMVALGGAAVAQAQSPEALPAGTPAATPDLLLTGASVTEQTDLGILVFEQTVEGVAGATTPAPAGQLDGAPVLAYVFPTSLPPTAAGFGEIDGILALAVTAHPDFDDTPLWDENLDGVYDNDGLTWHTHWVVLGPDERVPGGLAVLEIESNGPAAVLPPTAPGMPMYMDSPGFAVQLTGNALRVIVPVDRVGKQTDFNYDAVTCSLQVNGSDPDRPMLGVYAVYSVLSGDLSLPYAVDRA